MSMSRHDVIVIGAGMAGVAAARALARGAWSVVVLEASGRVGGRVHTIRDIDGTPVEAGAELIHGTGAATWGDVRAAGLRTAPMPYRWSWFELGGQTRWLPLHLAHPGVWRAFDILWSLRRTGTDDASAAQFINRKGYRGRARELAVLALTAHLPGGVEEVGVAGLRADGVLTLEGGVNHRILDGYDSLISFVATGLEIRHHRRVTRIAWDDSGVEVTAGGDTYGARAAITTVPHGVLRHGGITFDPALPDSKRSAIDRIATGPVAKVIIAFDAAFWRARMTQLVCSDGPVTLYWPVPGPPDGPAVLTAYATGPRAAALSLAGDDKAVELVLADLERLFPGAPIRRLFRVARVVDWTADENALGGYTFLPPGAVGARADLAAPDTGALFWAGSATCWQPVADTVEAAYLSGLRAAREASTWLRGAGAAGT
jgi:monoamine oxidase